MNPTPLFDTLLANAQHGILLVNQDTEIVYLNPWLERRASIELNLSKGELVKDTFNLQSDCHFIQTLDNCLRQQDSMTLTPPNNTYSLPLFDTDKCSTICQQIQFKPFYYQDSLHCLIEIFDITDTLFRSEQSHQRTQSLLSITKNLKSSESKLRNVIDHIQQGLLTFDAKGLVLDYNTEVKTLFNSPLIDITEILPELNLRDLSMDDALTQLGLNNQQTWFELKHCQQLTDRHFEICICKIDQADKLFYLAQLRDITALKKQQQHLSEVARIDPLTGIANRLVLDDRIAQALARSQRTGHLMAMVLLDLDEFKQINDSLGHQAGDKLLKIVANRLTKVVRKTDTVARLGGDEFCIIFEKIDSQEQCRDMLKKLIIQVEKSTLLSGHAINPKASIGACICRGDIDKQELYKRADAAMYQAKKMTRGSIKIYQHNEEQKRQSTLQIQLEKGLDYTELELYFQPSLSTNDQELVSIEALLRWRFNGKAMLPKQFISLMEQDGCFTQIERWVIHEACRQRKSWLQKELIEDSVTLAVNISQSFFYHPSLIKMLKNELNRFDLAPSMLELDIKEATLLLSSKRAAKIMSDLKELGVKIAIDNFGLGMSSLAILHHHPIDRIKLDKQLFHNNATESLPLIVGIIEAARSLKIDVLAEGIENQTMLEYLQEYKCDAYQGYVIAKPSRSEVFESFLKNTV